MTSAPRPLARLADQPYLLLSLTSLFWAGNAIVGRAAAGHFPPVTLSFLRWTCAFLVILPFAWRHLIADRKVIRKHLALMVAISIIGISTFNTLQYTALQYTTAINILLLRSTGPLFVALWALIVLRARLTAMQALGITASMLGVVVIILHGDIAQLVAIDFNHGDLMFLGAMAIFGLYTALAQRRPTMHALSFLAFTLRLRRAVPDAAAGVGTEHAARSRAQPRQCRLARLRRAVPVDPGVSVLQSRRAADRRQPLGAVLPSHPGVRLGAGDPVPRRAPASLSRGRLCPGADRRDRCGKEAEDGGGLTGALAPVFHDPTYSGTSSRARLLHRGRRSMATNSAVEGLKLLSTFFNNIAVAWVATE